MAVVVSNVNRTFTVNGRKIRLVAGVPTEVTDIAVISRLETLAGVEFVSLSGPSTSFRPWGGVRWLDACGFGLLDPREWGTVDAHDVDPPTVVVDDSRPGYTGTDRHALHVPAGARVTQRTFDGWRSHQFAPKNTDYGIWVRFPATPADDVVVTFLEFETVAARYSIGVVRHDNADHVVLYQIGPGAHRQAVAVAYPTSGFAPLDGTWFPVVLTVEMATRRLRLRVGEGDDLKTVTLQQSALTADDTFGSGPHTIRVQAAASGGVGVPVRFDDYLAVHSSFGLSSFPELAYRTPVASSLDVELTPVEVDVPTVGAVAVGPTSSIPWLIGGDNLGEPAADTFDAVTAPVPPNDNDMYATPRGDARGLAAHGTVDFFADQTAIDDFLDEKFVAFAHAGVFAAQFASTHQDGRCALSWHHDAFTTPHYQTAVGRVVHPDWLVVNRADTAMDVTDNQIPNRLHVMGRHEDVRVSGLYAIYGWYDPFGIEV